MKWPLPSHLCRHRKRQSILIKANRSTWAGELCPLCGHVIGVLPGIHDLQALRTWKKSQRRALHKAFVDPSVWRNNPLYRWVTLHPHGEGTEGFPVLIRLDSKGGNSGHIVAGAGGSLNYRRITGIKSPEEYQVEARRRRAKAKAERVLKVQEMSAEERQRRQEAIHAVDEAMQRAEEEFLSAIAQVQGWEDYELPEEVQEKMGEDTARRLQSLRRRNQVQAAERLYRTIRDTVVRLNDEEVAQQLGDAAVGELFTETSPLTGKGYVDALEERARKAGLEGERVKKLVQETVTSALVAAEEQGYISSAEGELERRKRLQEALKRAREEDRPWIEEGYGGDFSSELRNPEAALQVLTAYEKWRTQRNQLLAAQREVLDASPQDLAKVPRGAAMVSLQPISDEEAVRRVAQSLREQMQTKVAVEFLDNLDETQVKHGPLHRQVLHGRFLEANEIFHAVLRQPLCMRREVVDYLGSAGAAQLMTEVLRAQLSHEEFVTLGKRLGEYHAEHQAEIAQNALKEAQELFAQAQEIADIIEDTHPTGSGSLLNLQALARKREDLLREAQWRLGVAYGRLEFMAQAVAAFQESTDKPRERIDCALGERSAADAHRIAAALGCREGDYVVQTDGPNAYLLLHPSAWGRIVEPLDTEFSEMYDDAQAIKRGERDEEGWRPEGLKSSVNLSGRYIHQQRAIKLLERVKRLNINARTGGGKTLIGIGAFAHLRAQGKVKRGLVLAPGHVVGQFRGEVSKFAEPGTMRVFAYPSISKESRRKAYSRGDIDLVAVSHEAWRDDVTWAVAQQRFRGNEEEAAHFLLTAPRAEREAAINEALDAQGWNFQFTMVDEMQDVLNRKGKPNSRMANCVDATTARSEYYLGATATTVKNDVSEVYDALSKVRPDKFPPEEFESFRRRYGIHTDSSATELQRLCVPYVYVPHVDSSVEETHTTRTVGLSPWQEEQYSRIQKAWQRARRAPVGSKEARAAAAEMIPREELTGLEGAALAEKLDDACSFLAATRDRAVARILEQAPYEHNPRLQALVEIAESYKNKDSDGGQVPGIIFASSPASVDLIAQVLAERGFRVATATGDTSPGAFEETRRQFNADDAGREETDLAKVAAAKRAASQYDIIVCSNARATGANLERSRWLVHYDLPWTAMTLKQREGRQNRLSQRWPGVDVYTVETSALFEQARKRLVEGKSRLMHIVSEPTDQVDDTGLAYFIRGLREAHQRRTLKRMMQEATAGGTEESAKEAAT